MNSGVRITDKSGKIYYIPSVSEVQTGLDKRQDKLTGTGFVKSTAGVITYETGVGSGKIPFGWSTTAADEPNKEASIDGIALTSGLVIAVTFANGNSVAAPTLSVNGETARAIQIKGGNLTADMIPANYRALLQYGSRTNGSPTVYWTLLNPASEGGGNSGPFTAGDINLLGYSVVGSDSTSLSVAVPASAIAATTPNTVLRRPSSGPIAFGKVTPEMLHDPDNTLTGNRVYSSNGEWVAVPSAGGLTTGTHSNCDTTRTTGIYTGSSNSITGAPGSSSDRSTNSLLVVLANGDRVTQIYSNYTTTNGTAGRMWIRTSNSSSAWGDWKEIGGGGSGSQGPQGVNGAQGPQGATGAQGASGGGTSFWSGSNTGGNCNTMTTPGCYSGSWSSNQPSGTSWGTLLVLASDLGTSYREQVFIPEGGTRMWFRGSLTAAWIELTNQGGGGSVTGANLSGQSALIGQLENSGSAPTFARSDHYHALPTNAIVQNFNLTNNHLFFPENMSLTSGTGSGNPTNLSSLRIINRNGFVPYTLPIDSNTDILSLQCINLNSGGGYINFGNRNQTFIYSNTTFNRTLGTSFFLKLQFPADRQRPLFIRINGITNQSNANGTETLSSVPSINFTNQNNAIFGVTFPYHCLVCVPNGTGAGYNMFMGTCKTGDFFG